MSTEDVFDLFSLLSKWRKKIRDWNNIEIKVILSKCFTSLLKNKNLIWLRNALVKNEEHEQNLKNK